MAQSALRVISSGHSKCHTCIEPLAKRLATHGKSFDPCAHMHPELKRRYRNLFSFYDKTGDGQLVFADDLAPVADAIDARWGNNKRPFPNLLKLLYATYQKENSNRDLNNDGQVEPDEFVEAHKRVVNNFQAVPDKARAFIRQAAGGFFSCLDLDQDGWLVPDDLAAYAEAYGHPSDWVETNLNTMLEMLGKPLGRIDLETFLLLIEQYWFDPSPNVPGARLFGRSPE